MATGKPRDTAPHINDVPQAGTELEATDQAEYGGKQRSTAPDTSFATGAGQGTVGYDSPPVGSQTLGNTDVQGPEHADPYFPPGGPPDVHTTPDDRTGQP